MKFVVRNKNTGEIIRTGECQDEDLRSQAFDVNEIAEERTDPWEDTLHYFDGTRYVDRPQFPIGNVGNVSVSVGEPVMFGPLPLGTLVRCPSGEVVIDDENDTGLVWSSLTPGTFRFWFTNFPYRDLEVVVEVTE